ncbi:uncharacterized protein SAPINGB_P003018 [Magnusiomyces paraingens]|uniref:C3H1-type domain-containing protein n=1 Tax=Magnusiomyces paraingens TaxID=2606893 RepID=A0A5E8BJY5_9ASCO|nr:uncharacterized protein SAPINGB_P003018 [Saprochaete ingens]VVT51202.1 unnamed protein product [Saprochaete ingens]
MDSTNPYETFNYMFGSGATEPQGLAAPSAHHLQQQHHHLQPLTSKVTLEDVTGFGQTHNSADFHHQHANQLSMTAAGPTTTTVSVSSNVADLQNPFNLNGLSAVATTIPQNYQSNIIANGGRDSGSSSSSNSSSGSGSNTINSNSSILSNSSNPNTGSAGNPFLSVTTPAQAVSQSLMVNGGYTETSNNNQFSSQLSSSYGNTLTLPLESAQPVAGDAGYSYASGLLSWQHHNENALASHQNNNSHHSQEQQQDQHHQRKSYVMRSRADPNPITVFSLETPHHHQLSPATTASATTTPTTNVNLATAAAAAAANALALGYASRVTQSLNNHPLISSSASSQAPASESGLTATQLRQQQIDLENRALLGSLMGSSTFSHSDEIPPSIDSTSSQSTAESTLASSNQFSIMPNSNYFNISLANQYPDLQSQQKQQQQQNQNQNQNQQLQKQQSSISHAFDLYQQQMYDSTINLMENSPSMPIIISDDMDPSIDTENGSTFSPQSLEQALKLQPIAKKRTLPEPERDPYPSKKLKSMSTDLSESSRVIFESKPLADQIKLRFQAVFMTYIKMGSVAELVDRFSKLLLEIDTSGDQIPDPDPFSIAFEVALENNLELFWTGMRSQSLVITRCRVWIAKLFKARHWDQATTILNALLKMSLTQSHLETFKLSRLLLIICKKNENPAARKAAEMLLQRAEQLTELNSRPSQNGISGSPLASASDILKAASSRSKRLSPSPGPTATKVNSTKPLQPIEPITSSSRKRAKAESTVTSNTVPAAPSTTSTATSASRKRLPTKEINKKAPLNSAMTLKTKSSTSTAASSPTSSSRTFTIPRRSQTTAESKPATTVTATSSASASSLSSSSAPAPTSLASSFFKALKPHKASAPLSSKPAPTSTFSLQNHLKIIRGAAKKPDVKEEEKEDRNSSSNSNSNNSSSNGTSSTTLRKKRKRVHWKEDDNLVQVKEFYLDPEEAAAKRSALGMKPLDFNEAKNAFAMFRETPENVEMIEWYTPVPFEDYPGCEDVSIPRGGRRPVESYEAEIQRRAEEERLIAIYLNDSQIPETPNESLVDRTQPSDDTSETKIIPLADELASHPLLNGGSPVNDDDDDYDPSAFSLRQASSTPNPDMDAIKSLLDGLKKTVGTSNGGGGNKNVGNNNTWSGNQAPPIPAEALLTHLTPFLNNGPKNSTDNGTPSPEKKQSRWVNNNSTLTQKHLELRSKDVRPFVRSDQTTMDKWKFPCHFFKDHCDNGDQCTYLHLPN